MIQPLPNWLAVVLEVKLVAKKKKKFLLVIALVAGTFSCSSANTC